MMKKHDDYFYYLARQVECTAALALSGTDADACREGVGRCGGRGLVASWCLRFMLVCVVVKVRLTHVLPFLENDDFCGKHASIQVQVLSSYDLASRRYLRNCTSVVFMVVTIKKRGNCIPNDLFT